LAKLYRIGISYVSYWAFSEIVREDNIGRPRGIKISK